jgi:DNA-3-methyladenine glycosylase
VLIRALEPVAGIAAMERARGTRERRALARGPGRLAQALRIDRALDGSDLCARGPIWLGDDGAAPGVIGESVRIGITKDAQRVLRYYERGNPYVSGPGRLSP